MHTKLSAIDFFKGVSTKEGIRFQPAVPLFTAKNGGKAFPGMGPRISVVDWNNDGVNDLLIGTAVITLHDQFSDQLSWHWQDEYKIPGAGKVASLAQILPTLPEAQQKSEKERVRKTLPPGIALDDYLTMHHQGYIYVMLGKK
jgi:DNA polymerase/3'-5' exonuclease PolX